MTIHASLLRTVAVRVRDVSAGGCLLETDVYLAAGTIGMLEMTIHGAARVEWFRVSRAHSIDASSGLHLAGVEFLALAVADNSSLRAAIRLLSRDASTARVAEASGNLSSDPGNSIAPSTAVQPALASGFTRLAAQVVEFPGTRPRLDVGNDVAQSGHADSPGMRTSEQGGVDTWQGSSRGSSATTRDKT